MINEDHEDEIQQLLGDDLIEDKNSVGVEMISCDDRDAVQKVLFKLLAEIIQEGTCVNRFQLSDDLVLHNQVFFCRNCLNSPIDMKKVLAYLKLRK